MQYFASKAAFATQLVFLRIDASPDPQATTQIVVAGAPVLATEPAKKLATSSNLMEISAVGNHCF